MTPYQQRISEIVPQANARHIEALMRCELGTLDGIEARAFALYVRECAKMVASAPDLSEQLARSYGL